MSKFFSLARAVFSEDMNFLQYKTKADAGKFQKVAFPVLIAGLIMAAMAYYSYQVISPLAAAGLAGLLPVFFIIILSAVSFFEGIFKAQNILFECKDNDLLFALPISKRRIFFLRIMKLIAFQMIFNALFMLPVFAVYAFAVQPGANFYIFSLLMFFLLPLVPTAMAVFIGYIIKSLAIKFHHQKLFQIIFTFVVLVGIMFLIMNSQNILDGFMVHASSIADVVAQIYYPAGAFARLITDFNIGDLLGLLAISILPLIAVVYLCSIRYFKIISKVRESSAKSAKTCGKIKRSSVMLALIKREISRFFASPVFVINTLAGLVLLVVGVIAAAFGLENLIGFFTASGEEFSMDELMMALPTIYLCTLIFMLCMTSITSSSISMEGKSFNITKSLPVSPRRILLSKVLASVAICLPFVLISDIIFIASFPIEPVDIIIIILASLVVPIFPGLVGLLMNLKYPKLNAASDTEIVKQSMSAMLSVFVGMGVSIIFIIIMSLLSRYLRASIIVVAFYLIADLVLWRLLFTWGVKKFHEISA